MPAKTDYTPGKLTRTMAAVIATVSAPVSVQAAGKVAFAIGEATASTADGQKRTLKRGSIVNTGETIDTRTGRTQIRFTDGAYVSLKPKTTFKIDDYSYNGKEDGSEKGLFSLLRGGFRTITGFIGRSNRTAYQVRTPVATIGIRGTAYSAELSAPAADKVASFGFDDDAESGISAGEGDVTLTTRVHEGQTYVCSSGGDCVDVQSGQTVTIEKDGKVQVTGNSQVEESSEEVVPEVAEEFVAGEDVVVPTAPTSELQTGRGYATALAFRIDGAEGEVSVDDTNAGKSVFATFFQKEDGSGSVAIGFSGGDGTVENDPEGGVSTDFAEPWIVPPAGAEVSGGSIGFTKVASPATGDGMGWFRWKLGNEFQHGVVGIPALPAELPSNVLVTYQMQDGTVTKPTSTNGMEGAITSATWMVDYGANNVDVDIRWNMNGNQFKTYENNMNLFQTAYFGDSFAKTESLNGIVDGCTASAGICSTTISGFIGGNGNKIGTAYTVNENIGDGIGKVSGAAVGVKTGESAAPPR